MRKIKLIMLLLALTASLLAKDALKGFVVNESKQALDGVNVSVLHTSLGTVTQADGEFLFKKISGSVELEFSCLGYETITQRVEVSQETNLEVVMTVAPIVYADFEVTATRAGSDAPFAITEIDANALDTRSSGAELPEILKMSPSLVTSTENGLPFGNTKFRIRGSDPSRINVTVDGIPLNDAESQTVFWVNMTDITSSVSDIQIQRGVGASTNGAASFGASVNMQTKGYNANPFAQFSSYAGSYNTFKNSVEANTGLIKDHFVFNARLSKLVSDGYIKHTGLDHNSYFFSGGYFSDKTTFRVKVFGNEEHSGISWWGVQPHIIATDRTYNEAGVYTDKNSIEKYHEDQKDNYWQNHIHAHFSHQFSDALSLKTALHYTHGEGYYEQFKDDDDLVEYNYSDLSTVIVAPNDTVTQSDLVRQKWLKNDFYGATASLEYGVDDLQLVFGASANRYDGDHYGKVVWTEFNPGFPSDYQFYFNNSVKGDLGAFAKATYSVTSQLSAYADVQYRYVDYDLEGKDSEYDKAVLDIHETYNFLNPKAGLTYTMGQHRAFGSFGISNREPSRANLKDAWGDPAEYANEKPIAETLYDTELGYQFSKSNFTAMANVFYMSYKDQLVPTGEKNSVGYDMMTNVDKSYRAGLELSMAYKPFSWMKWEANATFSQNKIQNFTEYVDDLSFELGETDIAFSPNVVGASVFTFYPVENLSVMFNSKYVGEQYFDNTSETAAKLDAYFVNDLVLGYKLPLQMLEYVELKFMVNNIFDVDYISDATGGKYLDDGAQRWTYYFPQAFRNYALKMVVRF